MNDKPTRKQIETLHRQVQKLADAVYGKDEEGSSHARVEVHDKRTGQLPYQIPIPHIPFAKDLEQGEAWALFEQVFTAACTNVASAADALKSAERTIVLHMRFFDSNRRMREMATKYLTDVIVTEAFSAFENTPAWSSWVTCKGEHDLPTYYKHWEFREKTFETWLLAEKKKLVKAHGRRIRRWLVRLSGSGATLNALVSVPEIERPKHQALNRARREFLDQYEQQITTAAQAIEAELRSKKK